MLSHSWGLILRWLAAYAVDRNTVRAWLTRFDRGDVGALADGARAGPAKSMRPPKKVMGWVGAACQQVRPLATRLWQELGLRRRPRTLKRALRRAGGWKRTRRSLKRQSDPAAFATCRQQMAALHRAEQAS